MINKCAMHTVFILYHVILIYYVITLCEHVMWKHKDTNMSYTPQWQIVEGAIPCSSTSGNAIFACLKIYYFIIKKNLTTEKKPTSSVMFRWLINRVHNACPFSNSFHTALRFVICVAPGQVPNKDVRLP